MPDTILRVIIAHHGYDHGHSNKPILTACERRPPEIARVVGAIFIALVGVGRTVKTLVGSAWQGRSAGQQRQLPSSRHAQSARRRGADEQS